MRVDLVALGFVLTLFSASLVQAQVTIEVSKITCRQFIGGEIGEPRTVAAWLSGYYHGKKDSTTIDKQTFELNLNKLQIILPYWGQRQNIRHASDRADPGRAKIKTRTPSANKTTGQTLAYVYFQDEPGRCAAANMLTKGSPPHRRQHRQATGVAAVEGVAARHSHEL